MTILSSPLAGQLLKNAEADLVLAEWTAEGCTEGEEPMRIAPLHLDHENDEAWYILEGTYVLESQTRRSPLPSHYDIPDP